MAKTTSGPHAFAVRFSRSSRVHRISPRVRDEANALIRRETGGVMGLICLTREAEHFCEGLDRFLAICPTSGFCRTLLVSLRCRHSEAMRSMEPGMTERRRVVWRLTPAPAQQPAPPASA